MAIASSLAAQAITEPQARSLAGRFLVQILGTGAGQESSHIEVTGREDLPASSRWQISTPHRDLSLDDDTGDVVYYTCGELYQRAMGGPSAAGAAQRGRPFYASESALISYARSKLNALGWHAGVVARHRHLPDADAEGQVPRALIYVSFDDAPNGFEAQAVGNSTTICFDSLTGEIIEMQREVGYRYGPATVGITPNRALQVASSVTRMRNPPVVAGPIYEDMAIPIATEHASAAALALAQNKTCPLVYVVKGIREDVWVSAATGDVLTWYENAAMGSMNEGAHVEAAHIAATERGGSNQDQRLSAVWILAWVGVPLLGVSTAAAVLWARRGR